MEHLQEKTLKGYELLERIGAGGFGAVYKAYQSTIGREVAIKFILPGFANRPDFIRRFETEAHVIARLEHPYIVPLYDYWRDPEGAYLVMRWLRGGSLREKLKRDGALTVDEAHTMLTHICSGLEHAHRHDVIHRDIKPGNILLDEDGNAYLADFGIAKDLNSYDTNHTGLDEIVGSLDYLSPEQARSEAVSPATDVYSLGVMLFEMLAGQHPFHGASPVELLYKHINDPLPELSVLDLTIRDAVNEVIQTATRKNPAQRYQDVLAFASHFREAINASDNLAASLTQREYDVLHRIIDGLSNKEIADELFIAVSTVKTYVNQIYKKLGVRSRVQAQLRAHELNLLEAGVGQEIPSLTSSYLPEPENPYKGLQAFEAHDSRDFFGREQLIEKLIKKMQDGHDNERFLAVIGPSGSGKSSLVKAGLIPAIWNGNIPGSDRWFTLDMMPGDHPMEELEVALTRISANPVADLNEHLRRDERGLLRASKLILPADNTELVIVIDQFEELFTHVDSEAERQHFLDILYTAITDARSRIRVIITLRADFYDRPLHYPDFGDLVRSRMETILPLPAKELQQAIQKPAERVLVTFEEGLVAQIVSDVNYQSGALPLLQYALTELFEQRQGRLLTQAAYQAIGGVVGALTQRAENLFAELDEDAQKITRLMFLRLVTPGEGTGDTRRRVPRSELLAISEAPGLMNDLIDLFADHRMLSLDHDLASRTPTIEVAHESILGQWERLRNWINDSRKDIRQERALALATDDWDDHNRDASYLLRGSKLEQFEAWSQSTQLNLTPLESYFIETSILQREAEQLEKQQRQEREVQLETRSRRFLRGLVAVFAIAAIIAGSLSVLAFRLNNQSTQRANEFRSIALSFNAQNALEDGQPDMALAFANEAVSMDNPPFLSQQTFLQAGTSTWIQHRIQASDATISQAAYFPDNKRIATAGRESRVVVWDIKSGDELQAIELAANPHRVAVHPDGEWLAIGIAAEDGILILWNIVSDEIIELSAGEGIHTQPIFNRDGSQLISTSNQGYVYVWDTFDYSLQSSFFTHENQSWLRGLNYSQNESMIITSGRDGLARIWDIETGEMLAEIDHRPPGTDNVPWVGSPHFLNDDRYIVTSADTEVIIWNWRRNETIRTISSDRFVQDIAVTADGAWIIVTYESSPLHIYNALTGTLVREYYGHSGRNMQVELNSDETSFLSSDTGGSVIEWAFQWEGTEQVFPTGVTDVIAIAQHPTLPLIAMTFDTFAQPENPYSIATIYLVNTETGETVQELSHPVSVADIHFSPDGQYLLSGDLGSEQGIYVRDWQSGEQLLNFEGNGFYAEDIVVAPDNRTVASANDGILIWDMQTGELIHDLGGAS